MFFFFLSFLRSLEASDDVNHIVTTTNDIHITQTGSYTVSIVPNQNVNIYLDNRFITFLLPLHETFTAEVYKLTVNGTYTFVGSLGPQLSSFGVFFPNKGKVVIYSSKKTTVSFYSIVSARKCGRIYISTYKNEIFSGSKSSTNGRQNITIQNNQDICFIHASNNVVKSDIEYSTEDTYDLLYFHNGLTETEFTGDGKFSATISTNSSNFVWHSDPTTLSNSFSISLRSNSTLPPYRVNFTNTLSTPLFLADHNNKKGPIYDRADADLIRSRQEHGVVNSITVGIAFLIAVLAVAIGAIVITRRRILITTAADTNVTATATTARRRSTIRSPNDEDQMLSDGDEDAEQLAEGDETMPIGIPASQQAGGIKFHTSEVIDIHPLEYEEA